MERSAGDFGRVAIPAADAEVLRDLLVRERATTVIEVGLAYGVSVLAIAEALVTVGAAHARHVIIDAFQDQFHGVGWNALVSAGLTGICSLLPERSHLALPRLVPDRLVIDAAFVDGSHIFYSVFVDLVFIRELVRPGGLVVLDDCDLPSVGTAVRYFELNAGWRPEPLHGRTRLRAYRLPDPPVEPGFESFQQFGAAHGLPGDVDG